MFLNHALLQKKFMNKVGHIYEFGLKNESGGVLIGMTFCA